MPMISSMQAALLYGKEDLRVERRGLPELAPGMVLVRTRRVGICGSDLHYFHDGRCGAFVPSRPFILGHEFSGEVAALGDGVSVVQPGQRVAVNPARSCGFCSFCRQGRRNLCSNAVVLGSASTNPPADGAFAEFVAVRWDQCHPLPDELDDAAGAMIEPFAVAIHAVKRAREIAAKRILVMGAGTIGLLIAVTARAFGATPVFVSDPVETRRKRAIELGADAVLDPSAGASGDSLRKRPDEEFDVIFEASGALAALEQAFALVRPGGAIVQVGTMGASPAPIPANRIMAREIEYTGSMRYGDVFEEAIRLAAAKRVDLAPFVHDVFSLDDSVAALRFAAGSSHLGKVQLKT